MNLMSMYNQHCIHGRTSLHFKLKCIRVRGTGIIVRCSENRNLFLTRGIR